MMLFGITFRSRPILGTFDNTVVYFGVVNSGEVESYTYSPTLHPEISTAISMKKLADEQEHTNQLKEEELLEQKRMNDLKERELNLKYGQQGER